MPSPFPGMDPYLENPELWREVHHRLMNGIADEIGPSLRPKYRVAIEKRTYLSDGDESLEVVIPDVSVISPSSTSQGTPSTLTLAAQSESVTVTLPRLEEIRESYLEIRELSTGHVVTAIELLSPTNKRGGEGRKAYEKKRRAVLSRLTHLVEIDLLRSGKPMPILGSIPTSDYRILVSRSERRPKAELYPFSVRQEIPKFAIPLESADAEPLLDLQSLLARAYYRASFDMAIDYTKDPVPLLKAKDREWADALLRESGFR